MDVHPKQIDQKEVEKGQVVSSVLHILRMIGLPVSSECVFIFFKTHLLTSLAILFFIVLFIPFVNIYIQIGHIHVMIMILQIIPKTVWVVIVHRKEMEVK